jgi:hypothetical protein
VADREPPDWGPDTFSKFMRDAEYNCRATAANYPAVVDLLQSVQTAFEHAEEAASRAAAALLVPHFLFVRSHSAYLAGCRMAMSGQLVEAHAVLRTGLEQAWYGLHIAKDPLPPGRTDIWLRRNESAAAVARCKNEFTIANVRTTHQQLDAGTAADTRALYEALIDFGAHPNQLGVLSALRNAPDGAPHDYQVGILYPDELPVMFTLRFAAAVGVTALRVFRLVYPERFAIIGVDIEAERLAL